MITLTTENYISEGLARKCYTHPNNPDLCIKIGKPEVEESHLYKEINYFKKIDNKKVSNFDYLFYSKYYGEITTNLGKGFVYHLIKDETTNQISLTLRHYLEMKNSPFTDQTLKEALLRLKAQMIQHKIFVGDLRARNICCKILKNNSLELIVVDGMGHRDFFPLADWFYYFAKRKVERRFTKAKLNSLSEQRQLIKDLRKAGETII